MKNLLIFFLAIAFSFSAKSQTCPQTSCADTLSANISSDTLTMNAGFTNPVWTVKAGPGSIANPNSSNTSISGLKPGSTTLVFLQSTIGNQVSISYKLITVLPVVIPDPVVTSAAFIAGQLQITLSNGKVLKL